MKHIFLFFFICHSLSGISQSDRVFNFIENKGQWRNSVQFKTEISGGYLYIENDALTYDFYDESELERYFHAHHDKEPRKDLDRFNCHSYKVKFLEADLRKCSPQKKQATYYNYFLGSDRSKWASSVPSFERIEKTNMYSHIDLVLYTSNQSLKYDVFVHPKGDPKKVKMKYEGVNSIQLKNGNLVITTSVNKVIEQKPYAYQSIDGVQQEVECMYTLKDGVLGFEFPKGYDQDKLLVIDPTLIFSSFSGSTANNFGYTATFDKEGFLYSGSTAFGVGYPTTLGAYSRSFNGGIVDVAISKYDTSGTSLLYSTYFGGSSDELPHSMIANSKNELFVYGTTSSLDFPFTRGCYDSIFNGGVALNLTSGLGVNFINGSDIFVIKISELGDSLLGGTLIGGNGNDGLNSSSTNELKYNYADEVRGEIEIDKNNNVYVVSCTRSLNFPVSASAFQSAHGGSELDGVVFKMDDKLTTLIWSSYLGGNGDDAAYSLALDKNDNAYVAGGTNSSNFIKSPNAIDTSFTGIRADGFITKINTTGSAVLYSTYLGTDLYDQIYFIELDRKDSVYVFGQTDKMDSSFIKNAAYFTYNSGQFITKISPNLDTIEWSTVFGSGGGGPNISPTAFLVDVCNKIYLSGWGGTTNLFGTTNNAITTSGMDTTVGAFQTSTDGSDFYLMVLESDASNIVYGSFFGGPISAEHVDGGTSRFDRNGRMYQSVCAGCGFNSDFPIKPSPGAVSATNGSSCNNGVFKFDFNLPITLADFDVNPIFCLGDTTVLLNKSLRGTSFQWTFGDGNTSSLRNPNHVYSSPGTYIITLAVSDTTACNFSDTLRKQVTILSDSSWRLSNDTICAGSFTQIGFLPSADPRISYTWSPSIGLSDTTVSNPIASPLNTTTYQLLISNGFCTDTLQLTVVVTRLQLRVPNDTTLCVPGTPISIIANTFGTTNQVQWSSNPLFTDQLNSSLTNPMVSVSPFVSTTYYVRVGQNRCFLEDTVRVSIFEASVLLDTFAEICYGDSGQILSYVNSNDSLVFDWSPDADILSGDGTNLIWVKPNATTVFTLTVTNNQGCVLSKSIRVRVSPLTTLPFRVTATPDTIYAGQTVQLDVVPKGYNYSWVPSTAVSDPTSSNPTTTPGSTTLYGVTVRDTNCVIGDEVKVVVLDVICGPPDLFVPNAFTPNGDSENDVLYVRGNNITDITFRIYHRWGEKVFESTDQSVGWDGSYKGKECDPAVFVYYLDVTCRGGETYQEKGNITLIR